MRSEESEKHRRKMLQIAGSEERARLRLKIIRRRVKHENGYLHVRVFLNDNHFIKWFRERDFLGCEVDRIDNNGPYELDNMQLLTSEEHAQKSWAERRKKDL